MSVDSPSSRISSSLNKSHAVQSPPHHPRAPTGGLTKASRTALAAPPSCRPLLESSTLVSPDPSSPPSSPKRVYRYHSDSPRHRCLQEIQEGSRCHGRFRNRAPGPHLFQVRKLAESVLPHRWCEFFFSSTSSRSVPLPTLAADQL